jgi:hypothetical protein
MFSNKDFYSVNREERHFGFLLFSSVIYDSDFRNSFYQIVNYNLKNNIFIPDSDCEIYAEVALFRDYWRDLGDSNDYTSKLHSDRELVIKMLLSSFDIDITTINNQDLFWTGDITNSKLWFPGKWNIDKIKSLQKEAKIPDNKLLRIRWLCNAKPDFLIVTKESAVFIELKVESGIGDNPDGYNQHQTQKDIVHLSKILIPYLQDKSIYRIMITQNETDSIKWSEFIDLFNNPMVKNHMRNMPKPKGN